MYPSDAPECDIPLRPADMPQVSPLVWSYQGVVPYEDAVALQGALRERVSAGAPDYLLLLEHPPTITLGRRGREADLVWPPEELNAKGITVVHTDRGGQATYHGPGQLVAYPIMNLARRGLGTKHYVCSLETVILDVLATYGIAGVRRAGAPGIYVGRAKIAALGIHVRAGVTTHGVALNVVTDLAPFRYIVPCGVPGMTAASLATCMDGEPPTVEALAAVFVTAFSRVFGMVPKQEQGPLAKKG